MAILRAALKERPYLEAVFWDVKHWDSNRSHLHVWSQFVTPIAVFKPLCGQFGALYQHPRSVPEEKAFKNALKVMGDLYASAVATTVLQLKEIEPRPAEYDGMLCLGGLTENANENALKDAFGSFGTIVNFEPGTNPARLTFLEHEAAVHAAAVDPPNSICSFVCVTWNNRSYDNRGWVGSTHSNWKAAAHVKATCNFSVCASLISLHVTVRLRGICERGGDPTPQCLPQDPVGAQCDAG